MTNYVDRRETIAPLDLLARKIDSQPALSVKHYFAPIVITRLRPTFSTQSADSGRSRDRYRTAQIDPGPPFVAGDIIEQLRSKQTISLRDRSDDQATTISPERSRSACAA